MTPERKGGFCFLVALGLINVLCCMLLIVALSFAAGLVLSWWQFPCAVAAALGFNLLAARKHGPAGCSGVFLSSSAVVLALVCLSLIAGAEIFDVSWDGQTYHQATMIQLKEGWNPFYTQLPESVFRSQQLNNYGKGAEVPEAAVYAFSNKIQAGKGANIILISASFFLGVFLLRYRLGWTTPKSCLLAALIALNPVAIDQMLTYYVDGQVASLLCCFLLAGLLLFGESDAGALAILVAVVILGVNVKATMIGFLAIFAIGLLGGLLLWGKKTRVPSTLVALGVSAFIGICVVGFNPYVTNTLRHGNPLYLLAGKDKVDLFTFNSPKEFRGMNRVEKLLLSLCSHPDDINSVAEQPLKYMLPFVFTFQDIRNSTHPDTRIGGFGFLFEAILLLATALLALVVWQHWESAGKYLAYIVVFLLFSVLLLPEAWWARYVPQLWLVPGVTLLAAEAGKSRTVAGLRTGLYVLMAVNCGAILALGVKNNILSSALIEYQLAQFKGADGPVRVNFGPFAPISCRLEERHIEYLEDPSLSVSNATVIEGSFGLAAAKAERLPANVPAPFFLRVWGALKKSP